MCVGFLVQSIRTIKLPRGFVRVTWANEATDELAVALGGLSAVSMWPTGRAADSASWAAAMSTTILCRWCRGELAGQLAVSSPEDLVFAEVDVHGCPRG